MIDFHSHILPCMDDGSRSVKESCELLLRLSAQGIESVVATPHFYADNESVEHFLERRRVAYESLASSLHGEMPKIILGAEIQYYQGISRLEALSDLCIGDSRLLLLEMPFCKWTEYTVKEIIDICSDGRYLLVLAHIERYLKLQSKKVIDRLMQSDILLQANADFFINITTRKKALKMLYNQQIQLIGSDCHNLDSRYPRINEALNRIEKKLGKDFVKNISDYSNSLLYNR